MWWRLQMMLTQGAGSGDKYAKEAGTPQSVRSARGGSGAKGSRAPLSPHYLETSRSREMQRVTPITRPIVSCMLAQCMDVENLMAGIGSVCTLQPAMERYSIALLVPVLSIGTRTC